MSAPLVGARQKPIVIYRSVNRDGETYAMESRSLQRLREALGSAVHAHPRVFIAHETRADYEAVHGGIVQQVIQLLTGVTEDGSVPSGASVSAIPSRNGNSAGRTSRDAGALGRAGRSPDAR